LIINGPAEGRKTDGGNDHPIDAHRWFLRLTPQSYDDRFHHIGRFALTFRRTPLRLIDCRAWQHLQARAQNGIWRVRIEDIDPPREVPGAAETILRQLEHLARTGTERYSGSQNATKPIRERLAWLREQGLCYYCTCTRARIHAIGGLYDGHCRDLRLGAENAALRLRQTRPVLEFYDQLRGTIVADEPLAREDFIIHRRDGLFAYNLAVVVDDHFQGVSEIVRGADLIEPTVRQISLYQHLAGRRRTISICRWPSTRRAINCRSKTTLRRYLQAIRARKLCGR
jgi:glutamyl-Q tRNA(Asp) synthetase